MYSAAGTAKVRVSDALATRPVVSATATVMVCRPGPGAATAMAMARDGASRRGQPFCACTGVGCAAESTYT